MPTRASAPGRVNLIGDHTDYSGGFVLPVALDRTTTVELERGVPWVELVSDVDSEPAFIPIDEIGLVEPRLVQPKWARYVAGVMAVLRPTVGGVGYVRSDLPVGAGLSSSAALEVAIALALGFEGSPVDLALACQRAEHIATGVPCGVMDQLTAAAAVSGHALLIDCRSLEVEPVPFPDDADIIVVDSGQRRSLTAAPYGVRHTQCEEAAALIGPLRDATVADAETIEAIDLRQRARHVVTENERVVAAVTALVAGDMRLLGELMSASHRSLRDDFQVSTHTLDALVAQLESVPGVHGARLTGAGFGGCVVAIADAGTDVGMDSWRFRPGPAASVVDVTRGGHAP